MIFKYSLPSYCQSFDKFFQQVHSVGQNLMSASCSTPVWMAPPVSTCSMALSVSAAQDGQVSVLSFFNQKDFNILPDMSVRCLVKGDLLILYIWDQTNYCAIIAGVACSIDEDDCAKEPCSNGGSCVDLLGGYRCACRLGFRGEYHTVYMGMAITTHF